MRAVQVALAEGSFRDRGTRNSRARRRIGADQSSSLRRLPQRQSDEGRLSAASNTRACPDTKWSGVVDAVGAGVPRWKPGQRVGVGWNGGFCGYCDACRRGDFFACQTSTDHRPHSTADMPTT